MFTKFNEIEDRALSDVVVACANMETITDERIKEKCAEIGEYTMRIREIQDDIEQLYEDRHGLMLTRKAVFDKERVFGEPVMDAGIGAVILYNYLRLREACDEDDELASEELTQLDADMSRRDLQLLRRAAGYLESLSEMGAVSKKSYKLGFGMEAEEDEA